MLHLGIDVGGTKIAAGLVDHNHKIVAERILPTNIAGGREGIVADIIRLAQSLLSDYELDAQSVPYIGIGCPGTIDRESGIVKYANNLRFENVRLAEPIKDALSQSVYIENDANCAGMGEYLCHPDSGKLQSFVMITLGTGIGSAAVLDGKLYRGFNGAAPELGHCIVEANGLLCDCGARGCWEMYCAGHALTAKALEEAIREPKSLMWELSGGDQGNIDGKCVFEAYRQGDNAAKCVLEHYLRYFRVGIANVINTFQPEVLSLGGGICEQESILLDAAAEAVRMGSYCKTVQPARVEHARLGAKAGIIGAAFLCE